MKRYSVKFEYPQWRDNEYRLNATSADQALKKAITWHVKDTPEQGHVKWGEDDVPGNPHFVRALGISINQVS